MYEAKYASSCSRVNTVCGSVFFLISLPRLSEGCPATGPHLPLMGSHKLGGPEPLANAFLFSPPVRGVRWPLASLLERGNAEVSCTAPSRAKNRRSPSRIVVECIIGQGQTFPSDEGYRGISLHRTIRPENTKHAGAISAPAAKRALRFHGRPSRMRPWPVIS